MATLEHTNYSLDSDRGRILLLAAFVLFGLGGWIAVNGMFQELPLIARTAPEGYDIFSYATLCVAMANIVPALYLALIYRLKPHMHARVDRAAIVGVVGVGGITTCVLMGLYWDAQTEIFGARRSLALIVLMFAAGGIDCLTSVLFYPVLEGFSHDCVTALQAGEALTGLVAALMASSQSGNTFTVQAFFQALAGLMLLSLLGFLYLDRRRQMVPLQLVNVEPYPEPGFREPNENCQAVAGSEQEANPLTGRATCSHAPDQDTSPVMCADPDEELSMASPGWWCSLPQEWKLLMAQAGWSFLENGVYTTLLPHSLARYPDSETLISVAMKVGYGGAAALSLAAHFMPATSSWSWILLYSLGYGCGVWMLVTASVDAHTDSLGMGVVTVIVTILCKALITYSKTSMFILAQRHQKCQLMLRWSGTGVQVGALVGSVLFFVLSVPLKCFRS